MKLGRDYENSAKKVASYKNHLRFNLQSKHNGVVPASLWLHSVVQGKKADTIILEGGESPVVGNNWSDSEKSEGFGGKD